jgi:hypothetical protein
MKVMSLAIVLGAVVIAGCQEVSPETGDGTTSSRDPTEHHSITSEEEATTTTQAPPVIPQDGFASVLTMEGCRAYHVAPTAPNELAQRIVPAPYVAESSFPLVTDIIITALTCEAIVVDNSTVAAPAGIALMGVVATPPATYDDPDRHTLYQVIVYTDSVAIVDLFGRLGHDVEFASEVIITPGDGPEVYAVVDGAKTFDWKGAAYGGTKVAEFDELSRRFFKSENGSAWADLDLHRQVDSLIFEPGTLSWEGGPLAVVFGMDAGQTEATGVEVVGTARAVFQRAPDYRS